MTTSACLDPPICGALAITTPYVDGNNDIAEDDICVSGPGSNAAQPWAITTPIPCGRNDLVGALIHEFGHFTGLAHTANTVMTPTILGGTRLRYPYGDDIDCSAVRFGRNNRTRYYSAMPPQPGGNFGSPVTIGGGSDGHFSSNAAVGADTAGQSWFVSGSLHPDFSALQFTRAKHPVNAQNPGWLGSQINGRSRRPPSVASRPPADSVHLWGAAWTVEEQTTSSNDPGGGPNGIKVAASTDEFVTTSSTTALGAGSWFVPQEPTLLYDINTQRWMILFVRSDSTLNDEVFAITSLDLVSWTAPQDLAFQALDAPYASCVPFGYCTMAWVPAYSLDPKAATKSFTINPSTGNITWGSSRSSSFSDVPRGVGITASRVAGNPTTQNWLAAITLPGTNVGDLSVPSYEAFWSQDPGDPPGLALSPLPPHPGDSYLVSINRANIASDPWSVDWTYIITTH